MIIVGVATYPEYVKEEERKEKLKQQERMLYDIDSNGKLDRTESLAYWAVKKSDRNLFL